MKQIYLPLINAINYEKSIIDEIAGATSYNVSSLLNFSSSVTFLSNGGTTLISKEISGTPTLSYPFVQEIRLTKVIHLNENIQLQNILNASISAFPTLTETIYKCIPLTTTINFTATPICEASYSIEYTQNASEYIYMERERTHYVWDGGIILR